MDDKRLLFEKLIGILEADRIRYAIVGNTESYPDSICSDVDIMLHPSDIRLFHKAVWQFNDLMNTHVVQMIQHESVAFYYVIAHLGTEGVTFIQPDVCTDYHRNGIKLLSAAEMLKDVVPACHADGSSKGFKILSPAKEFAYYILKKIDKGVITPEQFRHLRKSYHLDKEGAKNLISRFWDEPSSSCISRALDDNDIRGLTGSLKELRADLHGGLHQSPKDFISEMFRKVRRCLSPTGFVVFVKGAPVLDGAAIQRIAANLAGAFRRQRIIDVSALRLADKAILFTSVIKLKIMSTLVVIAGDCRLPFVHADVEVVFDGKLSEVSCRGKTLSIPASFGEQMAAQAILGFAVEKLSQRTSERIRQ